MTATFDQPWREPLSVQQEQAIREAKEEGRKEAIAEVVAWLHEQANYYHEDDCRRKALLGDAIRIERGDHLSASLPSAKG